MAENKEMKREREKKRERGSEEKIYPSKLLVPTRPHLQIVHLVTNSSINP
jgi:hypothetical protein